MLNGRGEHRWVELRTTPLPSADGTVRSYLGVARDITERREQEEQLRSQAHAFQMMREGVLLTNSKGIIRVANPAFAAWFGRTPEQLVDTYVGDLPSEPRMKGLGTAARLLSVGSAPLRRILRVPNGAYDARTVEATITPIVLRDEPFWLTVMHDITGRQELEREVLEISNREQQRIGGDLHDGLGQELTGIALLLRSLANKATRDAPSLAPSIDEVARLVNDAIFTTRALARGLTPVTFDRGGISHAIADLSRRAFGTFGVRVQCEVDASIDAALPESTAMHLYRMVQEGIANAAKHGHATHVDVALRSSGDRCTLTIQDDGVGIAAGADSDGQGLKIMRYRAGMIGGALEVQAQQPQGIRIVCDFPLLIPSAGP
jgi:PAS domain S-box-containing protein